MEEERREAEKRRKERQFLHQVNEWNCKERMSYRSNRIAKSVEEEEKKKEEERLREEEFKKLKEKQEVPAIIRGGVAVYP